MASAAGVMNFLRTMAGAVGTAIVTTIWYDGAQAIRDQLSGVLNGAQSTMETLQARGYSIEQSRQIISQTVDGQSHGAVDRLGVRHRRDYLRRRRDHHLARPTAQARRRRRPCALASSSAHLRRNGSRMTRK